MAARAVASSAASPCRSRSLAAGRDLDPPGGISFPYAVRTLIAEISRPPMALIDGRPQELEPMQAGPRVDFGDPIGEAETIFTLHSEVLTFGDSFGRQTSPSPSRCHRRCSSCLKELAEASEERVAEAARCASPPSPTPFPIHVVEVDRRRDGDPRRELHAAQRGWRPRRRHDLHRLAGGRRSPPAGSRRASPTAGALPPERCIDPEEMFAELETRGVRFDVHSRAARQGDRRRVCEEEPASWKVGVPTEIKDDDTASP